MPEPFGAVVQISRSWNGELPIDAISAAYRQSLDHPVLLVLDGVTRSEVDRVLDEIVPSFGLDVPGVVYVDASQAEHELAGRTVQHLPAAKARVRGARP